MRVVFRIITVALSTLTIAGGIFLNPVLADEKIAEGKKLAVNNKKGNCLACHVMGDGDQAGNIGPPLIVMKIRFPDIDVLRAQISEPRTKNPNTIMPPFGTHGILTEKEIDRITAYIHSL